MNEAIYDDFVKYATDLNNAKYIQTIAILDSLRSLEPSPSAKDILSSTISTLLNDYKTNLYDEECKAEIMKYIDQCIQYRVLSEDAFYTKNLSNDKAITEAISVMIKN